MSETLPPVLKGLPPREGGLSAETYFQAFPWEGIPDESECSAGAFLEAL